MTEALPPLRLPSVHHMKAPADVAPRAVNALSFSREAGRTILALGWKRSFYDSGDVAPVAVVLVDEALVRALLEACQECLARLSAAS